MGISKGCLQQPNERIKPKNGQEEFSDDKVIGMTLPDMDNFVIDDMACVRIFYQGFMYEYCPEKGEWGKILFQMDYGIAILVNYSPFFFQHINSHYSQDSSGHKIYEAYQIND